MGEKPISETKGEIALFTVMAFPFMVSQVFKEDLTAWVAKDEKKF